MDHTELGFVEIKSEAGEIERRPKAGPKLHNSVYKRRKASRSVAQVE
jgi:hypothetical protein